MFIRQIRYNNSQDRVLWISVNIPTKAFCPPMCFLFVFSESCFYTVDRIEFGWRLVRGEDGRGWPTRGPPEIPHFSCKMTVLVRHQSILMKDHFIGTA